MSLATQRGLRVAATCALALSLAAPLALADDYDAAVTRAVAAKERALDANTPGLWQEALRLFQRANAIRATRDTRFEIAEAARRLRQYDLAVEGYEAALDLGLIGPPRAKAEAFVEQHAPAMARIDLRGPPGLEINIEGVFRGRLPLARPLVVFPGDVAIDVEGSGRHERQRLTLAAGQSVILDLPTSRAPVPAAPPAAIQGEAASRKVAEAQLPVPESERDQKPAARQPPAVTGPSPPTPSRGGASAAGAVVATSGVVLGAAATIFVVVSSSRISSSRLALSDHCADPPRDDSCSTPKTGLGTEAQSNVDAIASWKAVRVGSYIGLGVGAVALGAGAAMLLLGHSDASSGNPRLDVAVSPQGGWAGVHARF